MRRSGFALAFATGAIAAVAFTFTAPSPTGVAPATSSESSQRPAFAPTIPASIQPPGPAPSGMVCIPGGEFSMGSDEACEASCRVPWVSRDARPIHRVYVDAFWMDAVEVTNAEFDKFVRATGYRTIAERAPTAEEFPEAPPENLVAGSIVFTPTPRAVALDNHFQWWRYQAGADWRHPEGPGSDLVGRDQHPVVHIAYDDALAYAKWTGKQLPTEAQWEFAARGGLSGKLYTWGDEFLPGGQHMANTYQGVFPVRDTGEDRFAGISPVRSFPPNAYGLYDMAGNVWEWCGDWYRPGYHNAETTVQGVVRNPQGPEAPFDPDEPSAKKRVHRGGSYLCSNQYCTRYMVGTRGKGESSTASNHVGFRCVRPAPSLRSKSNASSGN